MLTVGNLTQNQSNAIFTDSSSIKMLPIVSAEWNQNLLIQPYATISSNATLQTLGTPTGATLTTADVEHSKEFFTTKYFTLSSGKASLVYPITTTEAKCYKVIFYAKSNSTDSIMLSSYASSSTESTLRGSSAEDIDSFGWTKIETYVGAANPVTSFNYNISVNTYNNDSALSANIYITEPKVFIVSDFDYKYSSLWPTDSPFSFFRPGESYITSGNNNITFPSNYRRVASQILGSETPSGGYYGDKYMPITPIINNPNFTLANVPVPFWKHTLPTDISAYKYFISNTSDEGDIYYSALYETDVRTNKLVFKFNTLLSRPVINIAINGTNITLNSSQDITIDANGLLVLYWTGSAWSTSKWSTVPAFSATGEITQSTLINKIVIKKINQIIPAAFTSAYTNNTEYFIKDASRLQVVEISPRLEIDLTDFVQGVSINKSLDSKNSYVPVSSMNSNDVNISLSGIPISSSNLLIPVFSNQSNLSNTVLSGMLIKNIKIYVHFNLVGYSQIVEPGSSYTPSNYYIPGGVFYSDEWQESSSDTVTIQGYDVSRYLQTLPVPDYAANLKPVFDVITNLFDMAGFTDYDYDSLYKICNDATNELDLVYYYCNSKDSTLLDAISDLFLAHQIGAYVDEYGIIKFLNIKDILSKDSSLNIINDSVINDGYSVTNKGKPGKISIRYQPPKIKQSPATQNATTDIKSSASYIYTTSNDVVWSQQTLDSIGFNYLEENMLKTANTFKTNIPLDTDYFHTYNLSANNYVIIEDEILSFAYKKYTISNTVTSEVVYVKNDLELQSRVNHFIKKYASKLVVSTLDANGSPIDKTDFDVTVTPSGDIGNVARGLFNTKVSDHTLLTSMDQADKPLSQATVNVDQSGGSYYVITDNTGISSVTTGHLIKTTTPVLVKGLIYPEYERDNGYKTYSTKFELSSLDSQSAGLFFNLDESLDAENSYFLELTKYIPYKNSSPTTKGSTKYILSLYQITYSTDTSSLIESTVAWADVTATVEYILTNSPQVLVKNGSSYLSKKDKIFNLRLSHVTNSREYPDSLTDFSLKFPGEDEGELVFIHLNNTEITGWQVPIEKSSGTATITNAVKTAGTIAYTANNTFTIGDFVAISGIDPSGYNILGTITNASSTAFSIHYSSSDSWVSLVLPPYVSGGSATKFTGIGQNDYPGWKANDVNEITGLRKAIKLNGDVSLGSIFGAFCSTTSIAKYHKYTDWSDVDAGGDPTGNGYVVPAPVSGMPAYIREIYACEKPLMERSVNYYTQDREFLNATVQGQRIFKKSYIMQSIPEIIGLNYYDVQYQTPAATMVDVEPIRYLQIYYPGDKPEDQKWWQQLRVDQASLSYSAPINTGYRTKMMIANNSPHLVWINKESDGSDTTNIRFNLTTHEIIAQSDPEIIEKVIDKSNSLEVAQIDSEWIQSKQSALNLLSLIEKSIDGFSNDTSLNIFGNPLIQVGDVIKLTYPLAGINQRKYLVHSISQSFSNGLTTSLTLNSIDKGIKYTSAPVVSKIEMLTNISTIIPGVSQQFSAVAKDQYGNVISAPVVWSATSGTINQSGVFVGTTGNATVTATSGSVTASTEFAVTYGNLTIYTVNYNEQGGTSVPNGTYVQGGNITLPSAPIRSGYTFNGWFTAATGGTALTSPYAPPGIGNISLYAQWTALSYSVTYNEQGGSTVSDTTYTTGGSITLPSTPTRSGYTFNGWFTSSTGGTALTSPYYPTGTGNITLYAQWTAMSYTVTYDEQGGSTVSDTTYITGGSITLPSAPTRSGYTFNGWFSASTGGIPLSSPYSPSGIGNITLYAQWAAPMAVAVTSSTYNPQGPVGTLITTDSLTGGNTDDGYWQINLPYAVTFNGQSYSTIYIGTNSYATFGGGSSQYSGLNSQNPALNKIMVNASDRGGNNIYFQDNGTSWRIRVDISNNLGGGTTDIVWELSSDSSTSNALHLDIVLSPNTGVTNVSSNTGTVFSTLGGTGTAWTITS